MGPPDGRLLGVVPESCEVPFREAYRVGAGGLTAAFTCLETFAPRNKKPSRFGLGRSRGRSRTGAILSLGLHQRFAKAAHSREVARRSCDQSPPATRPPRLTAANSSTWDDGNAEHGKPHANDSNPPFDDPLPG
jgi:hypothetical protein